MKPAHHSEFKDTNVIGEHNPAGHKEKHHGINEPTDRAAFHEKPTHHN